MFPINSTCGLFLRGALQLRSTPPEFSDHLVRLRVLPHLNNLLDFPRCPGSLSFIMCAHFCSSVLAILLSLLLPCLIPMPYDPMHHFRHFPSILPYCLQFRLPPFSYMFYCSYCFTSGLCSDFLFSLNILPYSVVPQSDYRQRQRQRL